MIIIKNAENTKFYEYLIFVNYKAYIRKENEAAF